jgi:hypothetical protein
MFFKISAKGDESSTIEKMKRIIFEKHYERKVRETMGRTMEDLLEVSAVKEVLI